MGLEGVLLKPSMVTPGAQSGTKVDPETIAAYTPGALKRVVPPAVPGIFFLSGGQSEIQATENLNAMNQSSNPWHVSFSYARALQNTTLKTWAGKDENNVAAQQAVSARLGQLQGAERRVRPGHRQRGRHRSRGHVRQGLHLLGHLAATAHCPNRLRSAGGL